MVWRQPDLDQAGQHWLAGGRRERLWLGGPELQVVGKVLEHADGYQGRGVIPLQSSNVWVLHQPKRRGLFKMNASSKAEGRGALGLPGEPHPQSSPCQPDCMCSDWILSIPAAAGRFLITALQSSPNHISWSFSITTLSACQPAPINGPAAAPQRKSLHTGLEAQSWCRRQECGRRGTLRPCPILWHTGAHIRTGSHILGSEENGPRVMSLL